MLSNVRKAVVGALATGLGALGTALLDGNLTAAEGWVALGVALGAYAAVWKVENAKSE